ncbi:MAG: GIY-YIG nuclease family protein, partial [Candidatus Aenigmatarchaeota archaeon]
REIMKGWSGIYVLYKDDKVYYIGKATSGFWRLWSHFKRSKHVGKWDKFSIFRFRTGNLTALETLILHISKPKGNKSIPRIPKDMELTKVLGNEVKEARKKAQKIEKAIKG